MNEASSIFLIVGATLFVIFFGLPLFLSPMFWAKTIGWKIPEDTDLANYLGRSLGGVVMPVIILAYLAARDPWGYRFVFDLVILIAIFQVMVHLYGFIRRRQPVIENLEIILYSILAILTWFFYPQPPV